MRVLHKNKTRRREGNEQRCRNAIHEFILPYSLISLLQRCRVIGTSLYIKIVITASFNQGCWVDIFQAFNWLLLLSILQTVSQYPKSIVHRDQWWNCVCYSPSFLPFGLDNTFGRLSLSLSHCELDHSCLLSVTNLPTPSMVYNGHYNEHI